ncbi:OmpA family protein [Rhodomicrobium vannielii]|uniref:OmpA family protein n=1 Tax=Rhodomicrobium vannielii TaxID=1069 RepID=UPI0002F7FB9B|nr:OmpA family protein [Rhodomicrobium vannielii]
MQSGQPQGERFGQGAPAGKPKEQGTTGFGTSGGQGSQQPGGAGQPQGGRFGQGAPAGKPKEQGATGFGSAGGQGSQQPGGAGQPQGGRFGQGAPAGKPKEQGSTGFGTSGSQGTQQPGGAGQPQGGERFGQGAPASKPKEQGTPGFGSAGGQGTQQPGGAGGIRPGFPGGTQQGEAPSGQPQGGRFGQGTPQGMPGDAQPQGGRFGQGTPQGAPGGVSGQGPAGKGPAGFGTGAPQLGGGQPPAGGPQFGGRPQFGQPASPQEQRERAERDTRRIEMGRKIEEDQRRQADRERSREGLDERMRLQNDRFRDIHAQRHERFDPNGVRFIEEPGNRKIFRLNNQTFIRHDETANFGHFGGRSDRRPIPGGGEFATFHRPDGSRVEVEVDRFGRPIRRVRILPDGRRFTLFENRALAAGLGLAAIGAAIVLLPPPAHAMPPEEYVVDAGVASEETIYDTLYAAPVEPLPRAYSLDEVLASPNLRDRMRSVRLNTIHFEFGSWEVRPDQAPLLQGIADSVNRIVQNNPGEVFLIEGHTDAVGTDEDNLSLSDRRAQAVADVLTQYYQVPRENLVTQGYGEQFLLVPTQGPEIRNRRVVIRRLTPLLQSDQGRYSNSGQGPQNDYRP